MQQNKTRPKKQNGWDELSLHIEFVTFCGESGSFPAPFKKTWRRF